MSEKEQPLKNRSDNTLFNSLYKINVKGVTEKRNNLTYLSWAWAWAEVSKVCEAVDYEIYRDPETHRPYLFDEKTGYMVFTSITVNGVKRDMWLPVMDGANKAMKDEPYTYDGDRVIEIRFIDPRRFTVQQRNFIYALIGDIFIDTGMPTDFWKEFFYFRFEGVTGRKISLKDESSTTVSDANILANIILDFIFEHHIPFKEGYEILPANQEYYFYKCITKRVCCICGKTGADIDHFDKALGRRKRKEVDHSEYTFAALCRIHHTEKHKIGVINFKNKYQIKRIIELTHSENWQEDKEIVAEVQKIGKSMWTEKPKRKTPRRIAIWHGDRILVTGTAEQLSEITGLSKNIIWDRARSLWIDSKGRQFRYVEEKK